MYREKKPCQVEKRVELIFTVFTITKATNQGINHVQASKKLTNKIT